MPVSPKRLPGRLEWLACAVIATGAVIAVAWVMFGGIGAAVAVAVAAFGWAAYAIARTSRRTTASFGAFTEEMHAAGGFYKMPPARQQYWLNTLDLHPDAPDLRRGTADEYHNLRRREEQGPPP